MNQVSILKNRQQRRRKIARTHTAFTPQEPAQAQASQVRRLPNFLGQAALLEWLGQSPIAFHRVYVDIAGGVLPALWLSSAMSRVARAHASAFEDNGDFVFAMSAADCEMETGITRAQQAGCRRHLIGRGLLSEQAEQRKTIVYRLHLDRIARGLLQQAGPLAQQLEQIDAAAANTGLARHIA